MPRASEADVEGSLRSLSLAEDKAEAKASKTKRTESPVVESWEDEYISDEDTEPKERRYDTDGPEAPPPNPVSTVYPLSHRESDEYNSYCSPRGETDPRQQDGSSARPTFRPEKQTAVAGRLIAGALGIRAPKKTEEQKAYDKAIREKETRRRNQEREAQLRAKEEAERAKVSIWED